MAKPSSKLTATGNNSGQAANQNAQPSATTSTTNGASAAQSNVSGGPTATLTRAQSPQQPTAAEYEALGLSVPTTTLLPSPQNDAPAPSPSAAPTAPTAPTAAPTTAAESPAGTAGSTLSRRGSARLADAGAKKALKGASPTKASRAEDDPTPREDAMQTTLASTTDRLTTDEGRLTTVERDLRTNITRSQKHQDLVTSQIGTINNRVVTLRSDMDRAIAKLSKIEPWADDMMFAGFGSEVPPIITNLESEQNAMRQQVTELIDGHGSLLGRVSDVERSLDDVLQTSRLALATARRTQDSIDRIECAFAAHFGRQEAPAPPPPRGPLPGPSSSSSRRRSEVDPELEDLRATKYARYDREDGARRASSAHAPASLYGDSRGPHHPEYDALGLGAGIPLAGNSLGLDDAPGSPREPTPPPIPAWIRKLAHHIVSVRIGAPLHLQTVNFGPTAAAAISRINSWTTSINSSGAIPAPIATDQPAGMPDNYRLASFNSHEDLVTFLTAWEERPPALANIIATPVAEIAQRAPPSGASLGLLPPRTDNNRGKGGRDSNGRRHF